MLTDASADLIAFIYGLLRTRECPASESGRLTASPSGWADVCDRPALVDAEAQVMLTRPPCRPIRSASSRNG